MNRLVSIPTLLILVVIQGSTLFGQLPVWEPDPNTLVMLGAPHRDRHCTIQPPNYMLKVSSFGNVPKIPGIREHTMAAWSTTGQVPCPEALVLITFQRDPADKSDLDTSAKTFIQTINGPKAVQAFQNMRSGILNGLECRVCYYDTDADAGRGRAYFLFGRSAERYFVLNAYIPAAFATPQKIKEIKASMLSLETE